MDWRELGEKAVPWLGNENVTQAVIFTKVLAFRNFAGIPFVVSASPNACEIAADKALSYTSKLPGQTVWRLSDCPRNAIRLLRERELIPPRAASFPGKKGFKYLSISNDADRWTLINEVEHLTMGRLFPGLPNSDSMLLQSPTFPDTTPVSLWAATPGFGYLASDPARIGSGLAWEMVLHLPGLALSRQLPFARNYLVACGLGFLPASAYSFPSDSHGVADAGIFRVVSRGCLGKSIGAAYESFVAAVQPVLRAENLARQKCLEKQPEKLSERVKLSFQRLVAATSLTYGEYLALASLVRLGAELGILNPLFARILEELRVTVGSGHLAVTSQQEFSQEEEDFLRAKVVKSYLENHSGEFP